MELKAIYEESRQYGNTDMFYKFNHKKARNDGFYILSNRAFRFHYPEDMERQILESKLCDSKQVYEAAIHFSYSGRKLNIYADLYPHTS